jgi:hypothetical protein
MPAAAARENEISEQDHGTRTLACDSLHESGPLLVVLLTKQEHSLPDTGSLSISNDAEMVLRSQGDVGLIDRNLITFASDPENS